MLSRVAAVKAPRTHNRRRVTGSSGRRREGRESERQRPNMSRRVFTSAVLLLFVMMCCNTGGAASTEKTLTDSEIPKRKLFVWRDTTDEGTVNLLFFPSLVQVNGDVFAVAEALFTKEVGGVFAGIASELLEWTDKQTSKELDKNKMKTQVLGECPSGKEGCPDQAVDRSGFESGAPVHVDKPTTVVHGSDVYMLAGMYDRAVAIAAEDDITDEWGLLLARGNVSVDEDGRNKRIYWTDVDALPITSNTEQYGYVTAPLGSGGSGVKMEDGTLLFPMEAEEYRTGKADEENTAGMGYTVSLFIYFPDNKSWKLSKGMSADGCGDPSVVEREKGKLMMMTACDGGRRRVYESGDKGDSWTEALGTLSRVWGNDEGSEKGVKSGFITATIDDNKKVILVTLPVYSSKEEKNEKGELHLWLTDNTHIVDIGPVSEEDDDVTTSSLLYKGGDNNNQEELIALYEKKKKVNHKLSNDMVTVRLTAQLQRVKEVLATWKEVDKRVSKLCATLLAQEVTSPDTACTTVKITDGLVGFLSDNFSDNTWMDEYLGVNATVNENVRAEKADNGVTFKVLGAGAEWPVGRQGENQLYHFANYNFTLVATVSIDGEPTEGNIPLLGASLDGEGEKKLMELSYDSEKKWILLCGGGQNREHGSTWEKEKTQHVVILLRNGNQGSAYVDGERVGEDAQCQLENMNSKEISHFYIGGDGDSAGSKEDVSVTVKNVLLYNRPLSSEEIGAFNPNKDPIQLLEEKPTTPSTVSSDFVVPLTPLVTPNDEQTETPSTPTGTQLTEQGQPMGSSKGAGSGGASASAVSTVSTSSAEEDSVVQVTSGTSPDGTQTMDAASSPDGNTAVETEARNTVQGDGSPQIPVGISDTADANTPTTEGEGQDGPTVNPEAGASSGENGEPTEETNGQEEEVHPQERELNAAALSSSLGNVSQGNNTDSGTVRGSGLLPSLLLLLLGLWGFAAL
ncbi:putative trans-sialidase, Group VI [Trypanosoma cruzi]|uniref:Trans-sialidase, putative n=2 Tax=Trypanosoma cruzi TaxID=5693 RepID=Q4E377_TRYCC|nr:trans-sialidase, putative [Trypanosoma cruzi]EAN99233.1 trans-sialidase, putative [Trypanosoma cruzi]PWV17064.1 putative trans-sialidase, Group VI [Trypanosoma cruzi]|eukprot:XP_821084.1 trans-sialidase [Trypanosoma cruzi strain CL Brener]